MSSAPVERAVTPDGSVHAKSSQLRPLTCQGIQPSDRWRCHQPLQHDWSVPSSRGRAGGPRVSDRTEVGCHSAIRAVPRQAARCRKLQPLHRPPPASRALMNSSSVKASILAASKWIFWRLRTSISRICFRNPASSSCFCRSCAMDAEPRHQPKSGDGCVPLSPPSPHAVGAHASPASCSRP